MEDYDDVRRDIAEKVRPTSAHILTKKTFKVTFIPKSCMFEHFGNRFPKLFSVISIFILSFDSE